MSGEPDHGICTVRRQCGGQQQSQGLPKKESCDSTESMTAAEWLGQFTVKGKRLVTFSECVPVNPAQIHCRHGSRRNGFQTFHLTCDCHAGWKARLRLRFKYAKYCMTSETLSDAVREAHMRAS